MEHLLAPTRKTENAQEGLAMASALGRAAMVGVKGIPATGASRRVAVSGAARRGFKTNPHVEVNEENCHFHDLCAMYTVHKETQAAAVVFQRVLGALALCAMHLFPHRLAGV